MKKSQELSDPNSCLNKAGDDELLFVLLARDEAAAATVEYWIDKRISLGKNEWDDPKITEARQWADTVRVSHEEL